MGGGTSKPAAPPPFFDKPWREINWRDKQADLQYVNNYKPQIDGQQIRILLHGLVGAGKSSFINSVQSVLLGRMSRLAVVANQTDCQTKKYTTYKVQKGNQNTFYPFVLNDIMGLNSSHSRKGKIHVKDVKKAMKGRMKDGYTFNPACKLLKDNEYYNAAPTANDKVHILVCVVDANTVTLRNNSQCSEGNMGHVLDRIQDIRDEANELGIPEVAIFTKIDKVCPEIEQDITNVYRSTMLKKKMEQFSADVGIPMNCIFPVKNYHQETNLNDDTDALILNTLRHILDTAEEFLNTNHT